MASRSGEKRGKLFSDEKGEPEKAAMKTIQVQSPPRSHLLPSSTSAAVPPKLHTHNYRPEQRESATSVATDSLMPPSSMTSHHVSHSQSIAQPV